jgi:TolB-like protein
MKRNVFFGFFLFSLICGVFGQTQQLTVAVSPFQARSEYTSEEADIITELFTAQLVASNAARVVSRSSFDQIMTEMRFQSSDWADNNKIARLGAAMNADSIITGQLMKLGNQTIITANLLDIKTAQIISSSRMQLNSIDQVFSQMPGFVNEMVNNLPQPNLLIGRWRVMNSSIIVEFKSDGTYTVKNYTRNRDIEFWDNSRSSISMKVEISGTYRYNRNTLECQYTEIYEGTLKQYNAGAATPRSTDPHNGREEKRETFQYSIDPARNTLNIRNFLVVRENAVRGNSRFTYISDFLR